jgi:hypothetical protein
MLSLSVRWCRDGLDAWERGWRHAVSVPSPASDYLRTLPRGRPRLLARNRARRRARAERDAPTRESAGLSRPRRVIRLIASPISIVSGGTPCFVAKRLATGASDRVPRDWDIGVHPDARTLVREPRLLHHPPSGDQIHSLRRVGGVRCRLTPRSSGSLADMEGSTVKRILTQSRERAIASVVSFRSIAYTWAADCAM